MVDPFEFQNTIQCIKFCTLRWNKNLALHNAIVTYLDLQVFKTILLKKQTKTKYNPGKPEHILSNMQGKYLLF